MPSLLLRCYHIFGKRNRVNLWGEKMNSRQIKFLKLLLARLIFHYYSDTLSGTDSEIVVYMDNEFEGTVERFINIDK